MILISNRVGPQFRKFSTFGYICEGLGLLGYLLSATRLGRTLTVMPIPKPNGKLCTSGMYKFVRHPIYAFILLFCIGLSLRGGSLYKYILTIALAILLQIKSKYEERYLLQLYPEYGAYSQKVPRFIPFTK